MKRILNDIITINVSTILHYSIGNLNIDRTKCTMLANDVIAQDIVLK